MATYQDPIPKTTLHLTSKNFLITSQAIANDPEKIKMNVDNFLKAVLRPDGEIGGWRPMEDQEAKDEEGKKRKPKH